MCDYRITLLSLYCLVLHGVINCDMGSDIALRCAV
jgi:hypothetical protein